MSIEPLIVSKSRGPSGPNGPSGGDPSIVVTHGGNNKTIIDVNMNPHSASYLFNGINEFTPGTLMRAGDIYTAFKKSIQDGFAKSPISIEYGISSPDMDTVLSVNLPIPTKHHRSTMKFTIPTEYTSAVNPVALVAMSPEQLANDAERIRNCDEIAKGYINILVSSKVYNEAVEMTSMLNALKKSMPWVEDWIRIRPNETLIAYAKGDSPHGTDLFLENEEVPTVYPRGPQPKAGLTSIPAMVKMKDITALVPDAAWNQRPIVDTMIQGINTGLIRSINYRSFAQSILGQEIEMDSNGELCRVQADGSLSRPNRLTQGSFALSLNKALNEVLANPSTVSPRYCIELLTLVKTEKAFGGDLFAIQIGSPLLARARVLAYKRILKAQEEGILSEDEKRGMQELSFPRSNIPWFMKTKYALPIGLAATALVTYGLVTYLGGPASYGIALNSFFSSFGVGLATTKLVFAGILGTPLAIAGLNRTFTWARACYKRQLYENMQSVQAIGDPFLMMATTEKLIEEKMSKKKLAIKDQELNIERKGFFGAIAQQIKSKELDSKELFQGAELTAKRSLNKLLPLKLLPWNRNGEASSLGSLGIRDLIQHNWNDDIKGALTKAKSFTELVTELGKSGTPLPWTPKLEVLKEDASEQDKSKWSAARGRLERACYKMNEVTFFLYKKGLIGTDTEIAKNLKLDRITDEKVKPVNPDDPNSPVERDLELSQTRLDDCGGKYDLVNDKAVLPRNVLDQQRIVSTILSASERATLEKYNKELIDILDLSQDDIATNNILVGAGQKESPFTINPTVSGVSTALVQSASRSQVTRYSEGKFGYRIIGSVFGKRMPEESLAAQANMFQGLLNNYQVKFMFSGSVSFQEDAEAANQIRETAAKLIEQTPDFVKKMWVYERPKTSFLAQSGFV